MSTRRDDDDIVFVCDECDDEITIDGPVEFSDAWSQARDEGWSAVKEVGDLWEHYCPECKDE